MWRRGQAVRNRKGRGAPPKGNGRVRSDSARSRVGDAVEAGLTVVDRMVASGGDASQRNGKGNVVDGKSSKPVFPELHRSHAAGAFAAAASVANTFERTLIPRTTSDQAIVTGGTMTLTGTTAGDSLLIFLGLLLLGLRRRKANC